MQIRWVICLIAVVMFISAGFFYEMDSEIDTASTVSIDNTVGDKVSELQVDRISTKGSIEHVVLCWLKDKNVNNMAQLILEKSQKLSLIPGVTSFRSGNVVQSSRNIVDDSFHVGFVMGFDSQKALTNYLNHPSHVSFVKEVLSPVMDKVVVYDIEVK